METHSGSCHCGKIRFEFKSEDILADIYRCNCSLCAKKAIVMKAEHQSHFTLVSGEEDLLSYQWNKKIARHFFCRNCGVYTHHKRRRDPDQISVNVACLDDVEMPSEDKIGRADGASHD